MFDGIRRLFREYFDFGKGDRNGIAILLALIALSLCVPYAMQWTAWNKPAYDGSQADFIAETAVWRTAIEEQRQTVRLEREQRYAGNKSNRNFEQTEPEYFPFNPNTITLNDAMRLGLSKKQAQAFIKYRTARKGFRKKEDLKKVYVISDAMYARLEPYIRLAPPEAGKPTFAENTAPSGELFTFDPNTITQVEAMRLGLSEKQAKTLIKYRTARKGFKQKEDLKKVYGISDAVYARLEPYIQLAPPETAKQTFAENAAPSGELFAFDPNTITANDAVRLGLTQKQANTLIAYRNKSGGFESKEDFKKLKAISDADYRRLEPFISLPEKEEKGEKPQYAFAADEPPTAVKVDINAADLEAWKQLPGIGDSFAGRILKYRDILGGFVHPNQLMEVYGMDMERFKGFSHLLVNEQSGSLKRININQADYMTLLKHPYIDKGIAKSLTAMRQQHGSFTSVEDIKKSALIDEKLYGKLAPYLTVE